MNRPVYPSLFIYNDAGEWCPAYELARDGAPASFAVREPDFTSFLDAARLNELAGQGRVVATNSFGPVIAVIDDPEPTDPRPARIHRMPRAETTWEGMRRLLNLRCAQLAKTTGEMHDDIRHTAALAASHGGTTSSMRLTDAEMEDAVSHVEHELISAGFDLDAADAAYRARTNKTAA